MEDYFGQHILCAALLTIMTVAVALSRRDDRPMSVLLCAITAGIGVELLCCAELVYERVGFVERISAVRVLTAAFTALAVGIMIYSWTRWKAGKRGAYPWLALILALFPLWEEGLHWAIARRAASINATLTLSLLILLVVFLHDSGEVLRRNSEEEKRRQAILLQEQMRPHFIFNALSAIRQYCKSEPELAASGIDNLSGYLRGNMDAMTAEHPIPFEKELEHTEQYVALEKLNPRASFEVIYELETLDFSLPALTLRPLVENAIHHGVRFMPEGMVIVSTERLGDTVRVTVEDNGPGFPKEMPEQQKARVSHGIENVRARLEAECGGSLHIHSGEGGTRVVLLLPTKRRDV